MAFSPVQKEKLRGDDEEKSLTGTPIRYLPLDHVYSATDPGYNPSGSSNVMSKKVKARKLEMSESAQEKQSASGPADSTRSRRFSACRDLMQVECRDSAQRRSLALKKQSEEFVIGSTRLEQISSSRAVDLGDLAQEKQLTFSNDLTREKQVVSFSDLNQTKQFFSFNDLSLKKHSESSSYFVPSKDLTQMKRISYSNNLDKKEHFDPNSFPSFARVYTRRNKKPNCLSEVKVKIEVNDSCSYQGISNAGAGESENRVESGKSKKMSKRKSRNSIGMHELAGLGIDSSISSDAIDITRTRERRRRSTNLESTSIVKRNSSLFNGSSHASEQTKKWIELSYDNVEPITFVGLQCKVYWPLDDEWYAGCVASYISETGKYHVKYDDGEEENVLFSKEKIKFHVSLEEMQQLCLKQNIANRDNIGLNDDELLVLAAIFDDCGEIQHGDIIWAKIPGHAMWPAVVVSESDVGVRKVSKANTGETTVPVQFFGTHDFAWITLKQAISFLSGLHLSYHLKCKQSRFRKSLVEAKAYLTEQMLPSKMICRQNGIEVDDCESASGEDDGSGSSGDDLVDDKGRKRIKTCPFEIDDLCVISLGKIVTDSEHFHDEQFVWPEGYTAERKFVSAADPNLKSCYKMEVLRDPEATFRPLFKVTMDSGEEFNGSNPSACWNKIYRRIRKIGGTTCNGFSAGNELEKIRKSGSHMFGFSIPKVSNIIKELSNSRKSSIYSRSKLAPKRYQDLPVGYRPVRVEWKDLDKCNVCHMDEEYADNVFLQCDKCRMMVHARCYGVLEPVDGVLWLCNLCCPGAPEFPPPCCLCPVIGGAMKPTTDGRWAHLACAIWIPETCLVDVKKMEPIDGLTRINKDRWKLLCSICGVTYGACIQCSNSTCRVAYHPLCARAADLCVELEDEDKLHLMSFDEEEDEDNQCIRLFSFCKKHRQPSNELSPSNQQTQLVVPDCSTYIAPLNSSGCARTEPYDFLGRRGRKEPEAVAAACSKQSYVENKPYLVTGYCQNGNKQNSDSSNEIMPSRLSPSFPNTKLSDMDTSRSVLSTAEKYKYMKKTFRMRLAFGKSRIHKFGVFAKLPHKAGDMVIEYIGELVRPSIADRREHFIYNSLVGAGTYMFRIDDNRVIDATKAGSIAHLINHSCEPNCYSRAVNIHGEEHVIIFSKRDINKWEELTYDYRFFSIGEQLACYCGFPRCRGVVNDIDAENQVGKLWVPRSELIDWKEDKVFIQRKEVVGAK